MVAKGRAPERLTVDRYELAAMIGVSWRSLDRHRDDLPSPIKIGRRLMWSREEVLAFLRTKKVQTAGVPA